MSQNSRKWLFRVGTLVLAGTLLYLALRGVDFQSLGTDLTNGHYFWALPLFAVTLISHLLRALRWRLLVEALPERAGAPDPISVRIAFSSLMIGYMINYVAPRFGEIVRTSHLSIRTRLSFGGVFGTVVAERLLDVLCLGLFLLSLPLVLGRRIRDLYSLIARPVEDLLGGNVTELLVLCILGFAVLGAGLYLLFRLPDSEESPTRFASAARAFRQGFLTLGQSEKSPQILAITLAIWACYALMAYIPLMIFDLAGSAGLQIQDAWALMLIGSIGVALPSPGGVGSYHFLTIQALVLLWGVSQASAASYAIFTHMGQMLLYIVTGIVIFLLDGIRWSDLRSTSLQDAAEAGIIDG